VFNSPGGGVPLGDVRKILRGCQRMTKVSNAVELLPNITTVSVGCTSVTDRRQTKNLLNCNIFSTSPHNIVNVGPLMAEIGSAVWDTTANFNGFRMLASLITAPTSLNGGQPNFARCLAVSWAGTL